MELRDSAKQATAKEQLLKELMDSRIPKTEREHAAAREIERLRAALAEDVPETNFGNMAQGVDSTEADNIPDAGKMGASVREDRTVEATIKDCLTVEPVAYVTGYFDGRCVIKPIEPVVLPTGMALYRSPPKREPLTESFLEELAEKHVTNCYFDTLTYAREIERLHNIGGEE